MKKGLVFTVLVVSAVVIVATATAGKPGTVRSSVFLVSNTGLLAANGAQAVVSGTYFCQGPLSAGTFSVSVNLSQTSANTGNGQGTFNCSADGSASAWTLIINATGGAFMTGKASAFLTVNDPNGDFGRTISGTDQISISSSTEGVDVPVPTGP